MLATDARGPLGIDEAIARAQRYAAEGADMIFVEAPAVASRRSSGSPPRSTRPLLFNVVPSGLQPRRSATTTWSASGYRLAIHPGALLGPVASAMDGARWPPGRAGLAAEVAGPGGRVRPRRACASGPSWTSATS